MVHHTSTVDSGTTIMFFDLPLLESAAGITLAGTDSSGAPASDEFQVGFPIIENSDFTLLILFVNHLELTNYLR